MKVRYFAWMKRTVGFADEEVTPPAEVKTVGDLVAWLRGRSAGHAEALAEGAAFGAAVLAKASPLQRQQEVDERTRRHSQQQREQVDAAEVGHLREEQEAVLRVAEREPREAVERPAAAPVPKGSPLISQSKSDPLPNRAASLRILRAR